MNKTVSEEEFQAVFDSMNSAFEEQGYSVLQAGYIYLRSFTRIMLAAAENEDQIRNVYDDFRDMAIEHFKHFKEKK